MTATATIKRRQSAPKTRTGCQTCKIRRIKCDEAKPACNRCLSTGRQCDGYRRELADSTSDDRCALAAIQRLPIHAPGTIRERRGFEFFSKQTAPELTGYYETITFWQQLILQASSVDSSLRHAVIAIGALHEEFANNRLSYYNAAEVQSKGVKFATGQYTKAIGHLRRSLYTGKQAPLTALMSCILFVCFDSLRGHFDSAMVHLQSGLKILKDVSARSPDESHIIMTHIAPIIKRLSLQAILYIDTRSTPERRILVANLADVSFREEHMPEVFESLAQARHCLNQSVDGLFRSFYTCNGELPMFDQPIDAIETFFGYSALLERWNTAYEKFMNLHSGNLSGKELRGAALLKIHHTCAAIMASRSADITDPRSMGNVMNDSDGFRSNTNQFKIMTDLSRTLVRSAELDITKGEPSLTFSTDLGLVGPLYYVCLRCQDSRIREEALGLLMRCPRREGMWDSGATARMVQEFWRIEEMHKELQPENRVVLAEFVDLVFDNEMRWKWKWKNPLSSDGSQATRESSLSSGMVYTPGSEFTLD